MKIQIDDPRLTDYLLGECTNAVRLEIEQALRNQPELQKEIESLRKLTQNLTLELQKEPVEGLRPDQIMEIERHIQSRRKIIRWNFKEGNFPWEIGLAIAASLAIGWFALDQLTPTPTGESRTVASKSTLEIPLTFALPLAKEGSRAPTQEITAPWEQSIRSMESESFLNGDQLTPEKAVLFTERQVPLLPPEKEIPSPIREQVTAFREKSKEGAETLRKIPEGFLRTESHPIATVALETNLRSFKALKKSIESGKLPNPADVEIDSILNAFKVNDATPTGNEPYQVHIQLTTCPWNSARALVRIALIARKGGGNDSKIVAEGVQWHFELNPQLIASYRVLGYDNSVEKIGSLLPSSQVIPLNFQRIVLLEIVPTEKSKIKSSSQPWFTVEIQHQATPQQIIQKSFAFQGDIEILDRSSSPDLQFAAATAQFGLLLKNSPESEPLNWNSTLALARQGAGLDPEGERQEFVTLIEKAKNLSLKN